MPHLLCPSSCSQPGDAGEQWAQLKAEGSLLPFIPREEKRWERALGTASGTLEFEGWASQAEWSWVGGSEFQVKKKKTSSRLEGSRSWFGWDIPGCTSCLKAVINSASSCSLRCPGLNGKYMVTLGQAVVWAIVAVGHSWALQRRKILPFTWVLISVDLWCCWRILQTPFLTLAKLHSSYPLPCSYFLCVWPCSCLTRVLAPHGFDLWPTASSTEWLSQE